jgi:Tol biopolymer transport system component
VMNPDGTNVQQLASFTPGPTCLGTGGMAWSPDGTRIAFSLNGMLEVMNADGSNPHPLGNGTVGDEPCWSPDSSQIVFHTQDGLWAIGADGTGLHQLTNDPTDEHPSWSADGQTIVFGSDRNDPYISEALPELYLVEPDGSNLRPLSFTKPTTVEQQPTFYSTTGQPLPWFPGVPFLAGHVAAVGSTSSGTALITLFNAKTGRQIKVVPVGPNHSQFNVAGGDAHWVVFQLERTISALNLNSDKIVRLTTAGGTPLDLSVSGRRVAWAENINRHGRIRTLDLPS